MKLHNQAISEVRPEVKGLAVVGVSGFKKVLFDLGKRFFTNVEAFNSVDEALDWLAVL